MMRILLLGLCLYSKFLTATSRATCYLSPTAQGISANGGHYPQGQVIIDSNIDELRNCANLPQKNKKCKVTTFSFDHLDVPSSFSSKEFGVHVHQFGDVSDQDLALNMGQHYAKTTTEQHGCPGTNNIHDGDLGNVEFSDQAVPKKNITIPPSDTVGNLQLLDLRDIIGRGIVFHGSEDQCNTAPPGRWAQCVIGSLDPDTEANVPDDTIGACSFEPTQLSDDYREAWDVYNTSVTGTLYFRKVEAAVQIWGNISGLIDITSFTVRLDMLGDVSVRDSTCAGTGDPDIYLGGGDIDSPLQVDAEIDSYTFGGWLAEEEVLSSFVGFAVTLRQVEPNGNGENEEVGCLAQCVIGIANSTSVPSPPESATTGAVTTAAPATSAALPAGTSGAATTGVGTTGAGTTGAPAATSADSGGDASGAASSSSSSSASASSSSSSSSSSSGSDESTGSSTTRSSTVPPTVTEDSAPGTAVIAVFLVICVVGIAVWKRDFIISTLRGLLNRRSFGGGSGGTPVRLPTDEEAAEVPMMPVAQERSSRAPERQERPPSFSRSAPAPAPRSLSPTRADRPAAQRIAATDWNEDDWKDGWDDDDMSPPTRK